MVARLLSCSAQGRPVDIGHAEASTSAAAAVNSAKVGK
jgi:hypothetical protein